MASPSPFLAINFMFGRAASGDEQSSLEVYSGSIKFLFFLPPAVPPPAGSIEFVFILQNNSRFDLVFEEQKEWRYEGTSSKRKLIVFVIQTNELVMMG
ncbi:hypothetical protein L6452_13806 [Arctium lappa]|uniref:Uncharacterized protein n=1 Tax=Arctium lappa TaxID=4217 RepID=A0ACB9CJ53_ARCLA|nr:hypothetical protein L6452_13806 [Arctium lappa]